MKKLSTIIICTITILIVLSGCEYDAAFASYRYIQDNLGDVGGTELSNEFYFIQERKQTSLLSSIDYPSKRFESQYIGDFVSDVKLSNEEQLLIKNKIDIILHSFYNMSCYYNPTEKLDLGYEILTKDLFEKIKKDEYFENLAAAVLENNIVIDIEKMTIKGTIKEYESTQGDYIYRIPCQIELSLTGDNIADFNKEFPALISGNANYLDIWFYFVKDNTNDYHLFAWKEDVANAYQVTLFSGNGIKLLNRSDYNPIDYYEDFFSVYRQADEYYMNAKDYSEFINYIINIFSNVFTYRGDLNEYSSRFNKDFKFFDREIWFQDLKTKDANLNFMGYKVLEDTSILICSNAQNNDLYCIEIPIAYEFISENGNYLRYKTREYPVGSYFCTLSVLIDKDTKQIYDWVLSNFTRKTFGVGYQENTLAFN